jgi:hypothetical protein
VGDCGEIWATVDPPVIGLDCGAGADGRIAALPSSVCCPKMQTGRTSISKLIPNVFILRQFLS